MGDTKYGDRTSFNHPRDEQAMFPSLQTITDCTTSRNFEQRPVYQPCRPIPNPLKSQPTGSHHRSHSRSRSVACGMSTAELRGSYEKLRDRLVTIRTLEDVSRLLAWDEFVCMPNAASTARGSQKSVLAGVIHDHRTAKELGSLIGDLAADGDQELNEYERAVVRDANRNWKRDNALSKELVARRAALRSKGYAKWVEAREKNDFNVFAPVLKDIVELNKEVASSIDSSLPPYDVLLDTYERGMTCKRLNQIFGEIKPFLVDLISRTQDALKDESIKARFDLHRFDGSYDVKTQERVGEEVAKEIGYEMTNGRLDVSVHPFTCSMGSHVDVRITTRYNDKELLEGLLGIIHECGHAMYYQGMNPEYAGLPVTRVASTGFNEGQALTWEWYVGRTKQFWAYLWPKLRKAFPTLPDDPSEDFYMAMNCVTPSMIRVDADELTYPLHVILRYEIEQELVDGSIDVENVPEIWNQKMQEYLGIVPQNDLEGCLQDVHWSGGSFGYFPTYTLGAMYGAQVFATAEKSIPNLKGNFANGKFSAFREWLRVNAHMKGSLYPTADELMQDITGEALNTSFYKAYLKDKYEGLYGLN